LADFSGDFVVSRFIRKALFILGLAGIPAFASAAPAILSVSFSSPDSVIHIGSTINIAACVAAQTQTVFSANATTVTAASSILTASSLSNLPSGEIILVSDGAHTWECANNKAAGTVTINNNAGVLLVGSPVADYTTLAQTLNAYDSGSTTAAGVLMTSSGGLNFVSVDIGTVTTVSLSETAGVWTGSYTVPDLGYLVTQAGLFGHAVEAGVSASNDGFEGPNTVSFDAMKPSIQTLHVSVAGASAPPGMNTNGLIYVAHSTIGSKEGAGNSANNMSAKLDYSVNKSGCTIYVKADIAAALTPSAVLVPGSTYDLNLAPKPLGSSLNGTSYWDAVDGYGQTFPGNPNNYVGDGLYTLEVGIIDANGVQGVTQTVQVRITSLIMEIRHVNLAPGGINTLPNFTDSVISQIGYDLYLHNDEAPSAPGANLVPALQNLGWEGTLNGVLKDVNPTSGTSGINDPTHFYTRLFGLVETELLNPNGSIFTSLSGPDFNTTFDSDADFLVREIQSFPFSGHVADCYDGIPNGSSGTIYSPGTTVYVGDGIQANDWDNALGFARELQPVSTEPDTAIATGSTNANPTWLVMHYGFKWTGTTPPAGSYRLRVRSTLTGEDYITGTVGSVQGITDPCGLTTTAYTGTPTHFFPTARPEAATDNRGHGIFVEDTSQVFSVSSSQPVTSVNNPPGLLSSNPGNGVSVQPGIYDSKHPLSALLQDPYSSISIDPAKTNIGLTITQGTQAVAVAGTTSTDTGTPANKMTVYFTPFQPLNQGGSYTLTVNTCDIYGNCATYNVTFTITDTSVPQVQNVEVVASSNALPDSIYPQTAPKGPYFGLQQILVTLSMPFGSQNTVDWADSTVTLTQGANNVTVPMNRLTAGSPTDSKLTYELQSPFYGAGNFTVLVTSVSQNIQGTKYTGPGLTYVPAQFYTVQAPALEVIQGTNIVLTALQPVTVTTSSGSCGAQVCYPGTMPLSTSSLPNPPNGYKAIANPISFTAGTGMKVSSPNPINLEVFYNGGTDGLSGDLPTGVTPTALVVKGYSYATSSWTDFPATSKTIGQPGLNHFDYAVTSGVTLPDIVAIFYSTTAQALAPGATPFISKNSKSFNPSSGDPMHNKARIYFGVAPDALSLDVKVYNTAGRLVKFLAKSDAAAVTFQDANTGDYYFTWDGTNDDGVQVRNGVYLIHYTVNQGGQSKSDSKMIAVVK
jgi:hypothetical protein